MTQENTRILNRSEIHNGKAYIDGIEYKVHNMSRGGFAIEENIKDHDNDKIYDIRLTLNDSDFELHIQCKIIKIWYKDNMCGFEFYKQSAQEIINIENYLKLFNQKLMN